MSAMNELRESLRAAAQRDIEAERVRTRRRRRRATGFFAVVLLGGAAAAGAADLISVGEPVKDPREGQEHYRAANEGAPQLVLTAASGGELPFGAANYTARNGDRCIVGGQLRGSRLGVMRNGTFRPYETLPIDACGRNQSFLSSRDFGDKTIVYGRAAAGKRAVRIEGTTKPVARGGAFLFVFKRVPLTHKFVVEYLE